MADIRVSKAKRLAQVVLSVFFNLTTAGVIFGFAALKSVLIKEGVYSDLCHEKYPRYGRPCDEQDLRINYMFTLSTVITNVVALPVGALLDQIGPKYTSLGAAVFAAGNVIFPLGCRDGIVDTYFVGFICLAVGGPLIFLSSFHLSNSFPARAGLILSCVTGAFDANSFPYLIYGVLYDRAGPISLKAFFWTYATIPVMQVKSCCRISLFLVDGFETYLLHFPYPGANFRISRLVLFQLTLAPSASYQRDQFADRLDKVLAISAVEEDSEGTASTPVEPTEDDPMVHGLEANLTGTTKGDGRDRVIGVMFRRTLREQVTSSWFFAIVFFLCIFMCRINYLIQTVFSQLLFFLHDVELARSITTAFTVLLPLGGIVGIPFVGYLLDDRTTFEASLVVLASGVVYGVLGVLPHLGAQFASIAIFVVLRPLMYTFVGDYCGKVFGFATFGTVYGLTTSTSGVFGMVLRPIDVWVKTRMRGDYVPIDLVGVFFGLLAASLLSWRI
ncbi:hypothetical protein FRB93_004419 [Tulasnella sp. JGI-2019a]|nr:hypothetical protein FRB93_004419 [Tulasnella sp. JGI-2019a]